MEKIYRDGIDIDIAFATRMKRHTIAIVHEMPLDVILSAGSEVSKKEHPKPQPTQEQGESKRSLLKSMLRPLARAVFRGLKPFAAPIVFRFRQYLMAPMLHEFLRTQAVTQESVHAAMRADLEIYRDIDRKQQAMHEQLARHSIALINSHQRSSERIEAILLGLQTLTDKQDKRSSARIEAILLSLQTLTDKQDKRASERIEEILLDLQTLTNKQGNLVSNLLDQQCKMSGVLNEIEQYAYVTARRVAVPCGVDEVLIKAEPGYILCSSSDYGIIAGLIDTGDLERGTRLLIERLIEPGAVYVDVGANVGIHVLAAARNLHGQGSIVCFEPHPQTANLLGKTVRMNGYTDLVKIYQTAVSDKPGKQQLFLGLTSGHHSLFPLRQSVGVAAPPIGVDTVCLDDVLANHARIDVIKIDVEGAELDVLAGAVNTLERQRDIALIVEFGPSHLARSGQDAELWLAQFERLGFAWQAIDAISGALVPCTVAELTSAESTNLFFARFQSLAWKKAGACHVS